MACWGAVCLSQSSSMRTSPASHSSIALLLLVPQIAVVVAVPNAEISYVRSKSKTHETIAVAASAHGLGVALSSDGEHELFVNSEGHTVNSEGHLCADDGVACTDRRGDSHNSRTLPCCVMHSACVRENADADRCVAFGCTMTEALRSWDCNQNRRQFWPVSPPSPTPPAPVPPPAHPPRPPWPPAPPPPPPPSPQPPPPTSPPEALAGDSLYLGHAPNRAPNTPPGSPGSPPSPQPGAPMKTLAQLLAEEGAAMLAASQETDAEESSLVAEEALVTGNSGTSSLLVGRSGLLFVVSVAFAVVIAHRWLARCRAGGLKGSYDSSSKHGGAFMQVSTADDLCAYAEPSAKPSAPYDPQQRLQQRACQTMCQRGSHADAVAPSSASSGDEKGLVLAWASEAKELRGGDVSVPLRGVGPGPGSSVSSLAKPHGPSLGPSGSSLAEPSNHSKMEDGNGMEPSKMEDGILESEPLAVRSAERDGTGRIPTAHGTGRRISWGVDDGVPPSCQRPKPQPNRRSPGLTGDMNTDTGSGGTAIRWKVDDDPPKEDTQLAGVMMCTLEEQLASARSLRDIYHLSGTHPSPHIRASGAAALIDSSPTPYDAARSVFSAEPSSAGRRGSARGRVSARGRPHSGTPRSPPVPPVRPTAVGMATGGMAGGMGAGGMGTGGILSLKALSEREEARRQQVIDQRSVLMGELRTQQAQGVHEHQRHH